jgi:hypothetical protein
MTKKQTITFLLFSVACASALTLVVFGSSQVSVAPVKADSISRTLTLSGAKNKIPSDYVANSYLKTQTDLGNDFYLRSTVNSGSSDTGLFCTFPANANGVGSYVCSEAQKNSGLVQSIKNLTSVTLTVSGTNGNPSNGPTHGIYVSFYDAPGWFGAGSSSMHQYFNVTILAANSPLTFKKGTDWTSDHVDTYFEIGVASNDAAMGASVVSLVFTYSC